MPPPLERSSRDMAHPEVQLEVRGFGPIAEAEVDLRPLTVFVGPSNAGKTYLATLIYALHRAADGFVSVPPRGEFITQRLGAVDARVVDLLISGARKKLLEVGRPFTCGDLPEQARAGLRDMLASVVTELEAEIERCFDVDRCSELARVEGPEGGFRVSLSLREGARALWDVRMYVPRQGELQQEGHVHDLVLVPAEATATERQDLVSGSREEPRALFEALIDGVVRKSRRMWRRYGRRANAACDRRRRQDVPKSPDRRWALRSRAIRHRRCTAVPLALPIELKSGHVDASEVARQLRRGVDLVNRFAPPDARLRCRPLLIHGRAGPASRCRIRVPEKGEQP